MSRDDGHCSACGSRHLSGSPHPWGGWCRPCEDRIKREQPWFSPGMSTDEQVQAKARWDLQHGGFPSVRLESCPFCGAGQGETGVHFCVATQKAPYIVECICCRGRTGGSHSFEEAALLWNLRPIVMV